MGMPITPRPVDQIVSNVVTLAKAIGAAGGVVCSLQTLDWLTAPVSFTAEGRSLEINIECRRWLHRGAQVDRGPS